jgi:hypothetical protein
VSDGVTVAQTHRRLSPMPCSHGELFRATLPIVWPGVIEEAFTVAKLDPFQYVIVPADAAAVGAVVVTPAAALA